MYGGKFAFVPDTPADVTDVAAVIPVTAEFVLKGLPGFEFENIPFAVVPPA